MTATRLRATDGADSFAFAAGDGRAVITNFEVGVDSLASGPYGAVVREVIRADGVPVTIYRYGWGDDVVRLPGVSGVTREQLEQPGDGIAGAYQLAASQGAGAALRLRATDGADSFAFAAGDGRAVITNFEVGVDSLASGPYGAVVREVIRADGVPVTIYRYGWGDDVVRLPGVSGVTREQLEQPGGAPPPPAEPAPPAAPAPGSDADQNAWKFRETFFDGFDGNSVVHANWPMIYGGTTYWNGAFYWDPGEVSVGNGMLTIGLSKQSNGMWSVGGLSTGPYPGAPEGIGYTFTYGRVDIRAKVSEEVNGAGPCFLLWPADLSRWPPEVNILETPYGDGMFTNHWRGPGGNNDDRYESHFFDIDYSQWHTYTLDWTPDRLALYVDGRLIHEFTENIPNEPMSVGLQGHVGAAHEAWYGSPNGTGVDRVEIMVDYVRVSEWIGG